MARIMILVLLYALVLVLAPSTADGRATIGRDTTVLLTGYCHHAGDYWAVRPLGVR